MRELNGDCNSASTYCLAWYFLRIAMALTTLWLMDAGTIKENAECSDVGFGMTMEIIRVISEHYDCIFNVSDREQPEGIAMADSCSFATRKTIWRLYPATSRPTI